MHDTAYEHGRLFFQLYGSDAFRTVVELGSQDVNGSLRDHCPPGSHYIGVDVIPAKGVDLVVNPASPLPLACGIADAVVTSSAFEHDICFWDTFHELVRILRPGGLLYVNVPSNGGFHRHPLDCWRFYPDAGVALVQWSARRGVEIELVESFIGLPRAERWADFVAVFRKAGMAPLIRRGRIADHVPAINIYDHATRSGSSLEAEAESMPDMQIATDLRAELAGAVRQNAEQAANLISVTRDNETLAAELAAMIRRNEALCDDLVSARTTAAALRQSLSASEKLVGDLDEDLAQTRWELTAIENSTSWRMTAGLRGLMTAIRGR